MKWLQLFGTRRIRISAFLVPFSRDRMHKSALPVVDYMSERVLCCDLGRMEDQPAGLCMQRFVTAVLSTHLVRILVVQFDGHKNGVAKTTVQAVNTKDVLGFVALQGEKMVRLAALSRFTM